MIDGDFYRYDVELSDRETMLVGKIVALWGALEYEVFWQTLLTYADQDGEVPAAMCNPQFSTVLDLWKTRVADASDENRAEVLQRQFTKIKHMLQYRHALVHGMWDWSKESPEKISTVRVSKKQLITTHFTAESLADFYDALGSINFKVRYPIGRENLVHERANGGGYFSRRAMAIISASPVADDLLPRRVAPTDDPH